MSWMQIRIIIQVDSNNIFKICTYNCFNFKANRLMVKKLIDSYDICFFIEHWLGDEEEYLFNDICSASHSIIFKSDFSNSTLSSTRRKRRPFGGKCWVIKKYIMIKSFEDLSESISSLEIQTANLETYVIYGLWLPFDDRSTERFVNLNQISPY